MTLKEIKSLKILGIIPSRLKSTRLPNKPLIKINGEAMISRVHRLASQSPLLTKTIVATDSNKIKDVIRGWRHCSDYLRKAC